MRLIRALILPIAFPAVLSSQLHVVPALPHESVCMIELAQSIARIEGWSARWTLVRRYHNPGALRLRTGEYMRFASDDEGWSALFRDLAYKRSRGWSWSRIIAVWSEDPAAYKRALSRFSCRIAP